MNSYKRLTRDDRLTIASMKLFNPYQCRIAEQIGCSQSAISQELARNSIEEEYDPQTAQDLADSRKIQRSKPILDDKETVEFIKEHLKKRRSPEQTKKTRRQATEMKVLNWQTPEEAFEKELALNSS